jgi:hypothetical protein
MRTGELEKSTAVVHILLGTIRYWVGGYRTRAWFV